MGRVLHVSYEEYGTKFGKVWFYLDGTEVLKLGNHESGEVTIPDEHSHKISVKIWGLFPVFKGTISAGSANWRLEFVQPNRGVMGSFKLRSE